MAATSQKNQLRPTTVNLTAELRDDLRRIASREIMSVSDIVRRACLAEIQRDREETRDGDDA